LAFTFKDLKAVLYSIYIRGAKFVTFGFSIAKDKENTLHPF